MQNTRQTLRRKVLIWIGAGAALAIPVAANSGHPSDLLQSVPGHYSIRRFTSLNEHEVYKANWASRNGRHITIGHYTLSQSKQILRDATKDWPATRQRLLQGQ